MWKEIETLENEGQDVATENAVDKEVIVANEHSLETSDSNENVEYSY